MPSFDDFLKIEMRVGTIIGIEDFPGAVKPAYKMTIDFGKHGVKKSSAQLLKDYRKEDLLGRQVVAVTNFPPKQVSNYMSEVLTLGAMKGSNVILLSLDRKVENGLRVL